MTLDLYQKHQIVQELVKGTSIAKTADLLDHSPNTVQKVKRERREQIERETAKYIEHLPKAVAQQVKLLDQFDTIDSKDDPTRFKASVQAGQDMMKAVGILPTNANSIAIQNIYNDNRSVILSDAVSSALTKLIPGIQIDNTDQEDILDVVVD